ncbi:MAG: type IV toxin-antitoxin system AbiEi family antitoxin domain-containing protein [Aeromicrobium sp.]
MDPRLEAQAARGGGYFSRGQAIDCGYRDRDLKAAVGAGLIVRLRHGIYAFGDLYGHLDEAARHLVVANAIADKLGHHVALSHTSACVSWGLDVYDVDLRSVHVTRLDGAHGRREAGVAYHVGAVGDGDVREVQGRLVMEPSRAVIEAATMSSIESSMVTASSALRCNLVAKAQLEETSRNLAKWQGGRKAGIAVRLSDGLCESVGEVRSLHLCWREGLPRPQSQFKVVDASGSVVARTDFAWLDHRHLGEFDGMVKYGRLNKYQTEPGRAITDEKIREDLARAPGFGMSRWTWPELGPHQSRRTADSIRAGMEQSKRLYLRNRTIIPL